MKDEVSSIYTYDVISSYIIPKPRAGLESESSQTSPDSKRSKTTKDTETDDLSSHEDSNSASVSKSDDQEKVQGIGDPDKGRVYYHFESRLSKN